MKSFLTLLSQRLKILPHALAVIFSLLGIFTMTARADEKNIPVTFSGGHETDRRDGGRPIVLIAAGLGVSPEVFREAFRGVTPARDGRPSGEQVRANKAALMKVLKPHGITNDRLDEVSDYYRYQPQKGQLWKNSPAKAHAVIEEGRVKKVIVTDAGSGYSSSPVAKVTGFEDVELRVSVKYDKDLKKNGSISSIEVVTPDAASREK